MFITDSRCFGDYRRTLGFSNRLGQSTLGAKPVEWAYSGGMEIRAVNSETHEYTRPYPLHRNGISVYQCHHDEQRRAETRLPSTCPNLVRH